MDLLKVEDLKMHFPVHGGILYRQIATVFAVDGVNFSIEPGKTLGLVGESGCGKSTIGRALLRLYEPTAGKVSFEGQDITHLQGESLRNLRLDMQMIFQDPFESLNPRHTIGDIIEEPFVIHKLGNSAERKQEVLKLLDRVGMPADAVHKYPHEFSGGQRQRIGIARAIALKPKLIICDEPVSALDVSIQSQILNLLLELQQEMGMAYLFVAHDLSVIKHVSDQIAVMYLGRIVEIADSESLYQNPMHPYTQALISSIPVPDPLQRKNFIPLQGEVPSPLNPPPHCHFVERCPYAEQICSTETPVLTQKDTSENHQVACHFAGKLKVL
ncbi:MAG: dipeptide ABC transporter ATP-binding protein [Gammaproteobacteria bacterium]|jgi:oligopeptide/dipeptide ABC transporter ATP-binding protein|nr:dipeptide ABC transporter ATP-binding protein [Gammaproteobacteria bacterium]MBT3724237.1 dipeptide ABC transporter ATP-binding protein [Gammaproteobacteria bacterium]MBT4078961.1 dipeptide ABC transporter ATP-binding protein [Gammaproteobacteria bacterium]MBT4194494.1 dipeptide ABC transporter ATP-binding protein [Gammaproteobacteria bacterium]MBT4450722.1 dipeptide ABC transporter ATP-binding protein [Gammaproteobacteria bacterium]